MDIRKLQFRAYRRFKRDVFVRQLFQSWHRTLRRYERAWGPSDLAYVYNEQAQVGLLAISANKAKGLPFIEFSTTKRQAKRDYSGRADLSILRLETKEELRIEAKLASVNCESMIRSLQRSLRAPFKKAQKSAETLVEADQPRLALVFVKLIRASPTTFDAELFQGKLYRAVKQLNADFCAIHFCNPAVWAQSPHSDCPGIAVIGKMLASRD